MFNGIDPGNKQYSNRFHLAEMVAYLGPPPMELLRRSDEYKEYFNEHGECQELFSDGHAERIWLTNNLARELGRSHSYSRDIV